MGLLPDPVQDSLLTLFPHESSKLVQGFDLMNVDK